MKKVLPGLLCLFICCAAAAQKPLTNSRTGSFYTYIYKLDDKAVKLFYAGKPALIDDKILSRPVDSFVTDKPRELHLPAGNYLKVSAFENRLDYQLLEKHSATLKLLENHSDLQFVLLDTAGHEIDGALVLAGNRQVPYDATARLYHGKKHKSDTLLQIGYKGINNFYKVKEPAYRPYNYRGDKGWLGRLWAKLIQPVRNLFKKEKPDRYEGPKTNPGYMVFNKPMYRPGDTIMLKAFVLGKTSKKPISDDKILVRLKDSRWDDGKIIGYATAYRKGGFEYRFKLTDSLDLRLDNEYYISLESLSSKKYNLTDYDGDEDDEVYLSRRKVYQQAMFRYEDYELTTNKFTLWADKAEHTPGLPVTLYFRATDDNGLDVPDGRVKVVLKTYNVSNPKGSRVFVPDTLWQHIMPLDAVGETKLTIPDSIFPKAQITYNAEVTLLNSNNEGHMEQKYLTYTYEPGKIWNRLDSDTLKIGYQLLGKEQKKQALLYTLGDRGDTLSKKSIMLPAAFIVDPSVYTYLVKADSLRSSINGSSFSNFLTSAGYRTADSLFISVSNPHRTRFWYTIFAGNSVLERGAATELNYAKPFAHTQSVSILLNYIWAGRTQYQEIRIPYQDKYLSIDVKQPATVFPGQQATISVNIKDDKGRPVEGADITAYAITAKFPNYSAPNLPYLGQTFPDRKYGKTLSVFPLKNTGSLQLNWQRWGREMGLDSIEYYRFTHPASIYRQVENNTDDSTQVAPFVVKDGSIMPVHVLYIDGVPVYFSQTQDMQHYSFAVKPGLHTLRFRTVNQNIQIKNVDVPLHKKLILSLNADTLVNKVTEFKAVSDTLTNYEANLIGSYLISIVPDYGDRMATLDQDGRIFLLGANHNSRIYYNGSPQDNNLLVGPLKGYNATFKPMGQAPWNFNAEPGFSYQFEPGLIKQKSWPAKYAFSKNLKTQPGITDYKQYALTSAAVDSLWQNYLDLRSATTEVFPVRDYYAAGNGQLTIGIGKLAGGGKAFVKNIIVYRNDDPDFMNIYPGNRTYLGNYKPGKYRILYLLKGNRYFLQENVIVQGGGKNFYQTGILQPHAADGVSLKIAAIVDGHQRYQADDNRAVQQIKETFNDKYMDLSALDGEMSGYIYAQDDKLPLAGVTVKIKGTSTGVQTNANGYFRLKVPQSGKLVISFIGFVAEEAPIRNGQTIKIYLDADSRSLQEVVVVAGGLSVSKQSQSYATATVQVSGKVAGINLVLRGNRSMPGNNKALVVVDGVIVPMDISNLDPDMIADVQVLNGAAGTALYGSDAGAGVIVITTKKAAGKDKQPDAVPQLQTLRKNFSDYAYWQPKLITDAQGNASFKASFPDDITNWRTFILSATAHKQTGLSEGSIKAYKPLSANFTAPLFAITGDVLKPVGKILNYTTDTVQLKRSFKYNGQLQGEKDLAVKNSLIDTFTVTATGKDSLSFEYTVKKANGYFDGEKRLIPVFEQGSLETKGMFASLDKDTTVNIKLDPKLKEGTFRAEASLLPALLSETEHLRDYEYLCNEQLASKLIALLAEKKIRAYLTTPFKYDKNIGEIIKKLQDNRRAQGTWGWWKDSDEELWISLHAAEALLEAEAQGFKTQLDKQKLIDYLLYQATAYRGEDKLTVMLLLQKLGAKPGIEDFIKAYQKGLNPKYKPSHYDQLRLMLVQQQAGLPWAQDSLNKWMRHTMFGNIYWGSESYSFFNNSIQESVLAYHILKAEGKHAELLARLRNYFLEQRKDGYWRNTYESAQILQAILSDLLIDGKKPEPSVITLSGDRNETVTQFPYSTTLTGGGQLTVKKTGTMPVYITAYQKFWNPAPEKVSKDFTVDTKFAKNGAALTRAKGGETITLQAEVTARADADFVMVEIPIPAGCSYQDKTQAYGNGEVHREYFKNKVSIFCRKLSQGKHTFAVTLTARYGGNYHVNPAKAEMMYFPVFYGREAMKMFVIE